LEEAGTHDFLRSETILSVEHAERYVSIHLESDSSTWVDLLSRLTRSFKTRNSRAKREFSYGSCLAATADNTGVADDSKKVPSSPMDNFILNVDRDLKEMNDCLEDNFRA
jgi:hypothetical protein